MRSFVLTFLALITAVGCKPQAPTPGGGVLDDANETYVKNVHIAGDKKPFLSCSEM